MNARTADFAATTPWSGIQDKPTSFGPTAHASTHAAGGSDPVSLAISQVVGLAQALAAARPGLSERETQNLIRHTLEAFLTAEEIAELYLTIVDAASTYLTIANAAATYLTIANAASTYQPLTGNTFNVAGLPAANLNIGRVVYCLNGASGSACAAISDGVDWKQIALGANVTP